MLFMFNFTVFLSPAVKTEEYYSCSFCSLGSALAASNVSYFQGQIKTSKADEARQQVIDQLCVFELEWQQYSDLTTSSEKSW